MKKKHTSKIGPILRRMNKDMDRLRKIARDMKEDVEQGDQAGTLDVETGRLLDMTQPEIHSAIEHLDNARLVLEDAVCAWPKECWPEEWRS